jgi:hypothetical protein
VERLADIITGAMADFISPLSVISSTSFQIPMWMMAYRCLGSKLIHNFNLFTIFSMSK